MIVIENRSLSRRNFLQKTAVGLGGVALSTILSASNQPTMGTHFPARAKRVIQIFCSGGLSHIDTFDYKPELERRAGTPFDPGGKLQFFASKPGNCQPSFWKFRQHGQSGVWMSDLIARVRFITSSLYCYEIICLMCRGFSIWSISGKSRPCELGKLMFRWETRHRSKRDRSRPKRLVKSFMT